MKRLQYCFVTIAYVLLCNVAQGTHLRAGEITVEQVSCPGRQYKITITAYINFINTTVAFGGQWPLQFGDNTAVIVPEIPNYEIVDASRGIGRVKFTVIHTYSTYGRFKISYREESRNLRILNIENSASTAFYLETVIEVSADACNSSPKLLIPPIDRACKGIAFYHSIGGFDEDGDSLSYSTVVPAQGDGVPVINYRTPSSREFYPSSNYPRANEAADGEPRLFFTNSTLVWDAPGGVGEYVVALKITEWRKNAAGQWRETGYVIRDMQIIVDDCQNLKPSLQNVSDYCIDAGEALNIMLKAKDPDGDPVVIEVFSDLLDGNRAMSVSPGPAIQSTALPQDTAHVLIRWQTRCEDIQRNPYRIVVKISDRSPTGSRLVQFYTIHVKVMAPPVQVTSVSVNPVSKIIKLQWRYACSNVHAFQIWRRVSQIPYQQAPCEQGMPANLQYNLIGTVSANITQFTDSQVDIGAQYCYRLLAIVGGEALESRLSIDTCIIPKPAQAPMMTKVSIEETDSSTGSIQLQWTPPFDIDQQQYPPPYAYRVLRKSSSEGDQSFTPSSGILTSTTFIDHPLNTASETYSYRIELYVPYLTTAPIDTSSAAGSVFLSTTPMEQRIGLSWDADTPWSNFAYDRPHHLIFRSETKDGPFLLRDSVNVLMQGQRYIDDIVGTRTSYYYRIQTRGTYGNPDVFSPLENYSQVIRGEILDLIPPCAPLLTIQPTDCRQYACDGKSYYNKISWTLTSGEGCDSDASRYELFVSEGGDDFQLLSVTDAIEFEHGGLTEREKIYRVMAVDRAGNKSDPSNEASNPNCLNLSFPNIITLSPRDNQNDVFQPFSDQRNDEDCYRSVVRVDYTLYTRDGIPVIQTTAVPDDPFIIWDTSLASDEISPAIYFYEAQVIFNTRDDARVKQDLKGWVQVVK